MQVKLKRSFCAALMAFGVALTQDAHAGPASDALSACLMQSTTVDDRTTLVTWMFTMATLHPGVAPIANVSQERRMAANQQMAALFQRLLTVDCRPQAVQALRDDGQKATEMGFQQLGQAAGRELFGHPSVAAGMAGLMVFLDPKSFESLMAEVKAP